MWNPGRSRDPQRKQNKPTFIYLFIYRTAGLGLRLRTVITHYQQRRRAVITGRRVWCKASRGADEVAQHKTVQTSNGILWRAKVKAVNAPETSAIIRITCLVQVNLKMMMNLKRSACVESLQRYTLDKMFISWKCFSPFCFCQTRSFFLSLSLWTPGCSSPPSYVSCLTAFQLHNPENTFILPLAGIQPWRAPHCL